MAPQQNSTLIDGNLEVCPSLLNIPGEINRYSPILPPKNKENLDKNNNNNYNNIKNNNNNNNNNIINNYHEHQDVNYIPKWEPTERELRNYYKYKHHRSGSNRSGHSRRSRSISLYGVNSTLEQGHKEITIWLSDEPRYVSGVTNKTTCNDIIKALIDDEISNGNYEYCQRFKDGTASRDYSDYVITECWRGIERSYDGNMAILPVWKAWSRVHNEIRLSLKHHKDIQDPVKALKNNTTLSSIRDYICKLLTFGKNKKRNTKSKKSNKSTKSKKEDKENPTKSNDLMLLQNINEDICTKNAEAKVKSSNIKPTIEETEIQAKTKINKEKLYKLSETRSSIRKRRSASRRKDKRSSHDRRRDSVDFNNFLRKRKDSSIRSSVRNKLAQKNAEMNELYDREYALTKELTNKCKMYKLQNDLYTTSDKNLEISVGQIQKSIEECAKEIIQTEHELLEVKNEIKHDISIINNLKRLTLDADLNDCGVPIDLDNILKPPPTVLEPTPTATIETKDQMFFVDNIYEFCDNNASMLV
ncbi:probable WRKY transcription factor protein 1 [Lucilia sericata]|uniref:probable WRKY transcription factor protein 1 n=1 Tax=Lucilia sericata TaxID=13632 RepID=UPI0018A81419|nr:probable WRKY transcription factor protein 1 [Lucilia sericata]